MTTTSINKLQARQASASRLLLLAAAVASVASLAFELASGAQLSVGIEHDMSKPTYGLQGPSSSQLTYDDRTGLNMKGTINDILGPPVKMANGFNSMIAGGNMASIGSGIKTGGAMLGFDAKLLEAAGGANLLKGGLLMGGAKALGGAAFLRHGLPGKKIASVIELPVKVVAMKDIGIGKGLMGVGKLKEAEALAAKEKGVNMIKEGDALKLQGMNQVMQGATEGLQNIGNMMKQTANDAASAVKFLPIILDMPMQQQQQQQQTIEQQPEQHQTKQQQQHLESVPHQMQQPSPLTGGSLFGGLSSLMPGLAASDPFSAALSGVGGTGAGQLKSMPTLNSLFGLGGSQAGAHTNGYAAMLNASNPLSNLLMSPGLNPFLYPLGSGALGGGPLAQAFQDKMPSAASGQNLFNPSQSSSYSYNLFPGLKVSESTSSHMPDLSKLHQQQQQQQPQTQQHLEKTNTEHQQNIGGQKQLETKS